MVRVAEPYDARERPLKVAAVMGLTERVFPRRITEDPFLRDEERVALAQWAGLDLEEQKGRADDERFFFYLAVTAPCRTPDPLLSPLRRRIRHPALVLSGRSADALCAESRNCLNVVSRTLADVAPRPKRWFPMPTVCWRRARGCSIRARPLPPTMPRVWPRRGPDADVFAGRGTAADHAARRRIARPAPSAASPVRPSAPRFRHQPHGVQRVRTGKLWTLPVPVFSAPCPASASRRGRQRTFALRGRFYTPFCTVIFIGATD